VGRTASHTLRPQIASERGYALASNRDGQWLMQLGEWTGAILTAVVTLGTFHILTGYLATLALSIQFAHVNDHIYQTKWPMTFWYTFTSLTTFNVQTKVFFGNDLTARLSEVVFVLPSNLT